MKSDSFPVDMEPFSHLTNKDLAFNSRVNLQRSLSRKGSQIGEEKKMNNPSIDNERDDVSSPRDMMLEKSLPIESNDPQVQHQITINTGGATVAATTNSVRPSIKNRPIEKRSNSFKQTSVINPRRILFFFATLSSMGTLLLIYFTLSVAKYSGEDNLLN